MSDRPCLSPAYGPSEHAPELVEIIDAWPALPEPIRAGLLAMVRSVSGKGRMIVGSEMTKSHPL